MSPSFSFSPLSFLYLLPCFLLLPFLLLCLAAPWPPSANQSTRPFLAASSEVKILKKEKKKKEKKKEKKKRRAGQGIRPSLPMEKEKKEKKKEKKERKRREGREEGEENQEGYQIKRKQRGG